MGDRQEQVLGEHFFQGCPAKQITPESYQYLNLFKLTHQFTRIGVLRTISFEEIGQLPNQCVQAFDVIKDEIIKISNAENTNNEP